MKLIILTAVCYATGAFAQQSFNNKPPPAGGWTKCSKKESEIPGYCQTYDQYGKVLTGRLKQKCRVQAPCYNEDNGCRMNAIQLGYTWFADCSKPEAGSAAAPDKKPAKKPTN